MFRSDHYTIGEPDQESLEAWVSLTYAATFYGPEPDRGLQFPGSNAKFEPGHTDFFYFSFTIAVTAQTSDVSVTTRKMRRLVLFQSVLSFVFNTTILAFAINAAAGFFCG